MTADLHTYKMRHVWRHSVEQDTAVNTFKL